MSGGLSHIGLKSADLGRTERFYVDVMGGSVLRRRDEPDRRVWLDVRGVRLEIAEVSRWPMLSDEHRQMLPTVSFLVVPDEVDPIVARLQSAGVPFREPMLKATGPGVGVYFADPDGNPLSLSCPEGYAREGLQRSLHNTWVPSPYEWDPAVTGASGA
jgi:catechol 2,3-dioxygenase-like lactoylglutathione lyase family enzyme